MTNVIRLSSVGRNPLSARTPVSVPVLAEQPSLGGPADELTDERARHPGDGSDAANSLSTPTCSSTAMIASHVRRSLRLSPEPSSSSTPSSGTCHAASVFQISCNPATRVPSPRTANPISFTSSSAVLLSLVCNSSSTTSASGAESTPPSTVTDPSAGAAPLRLRPVTAMLRACSNRMNWRAADWFGLNPIVLSANVRPSLTISASYGPASVPSTCSAPHDGTTNSSS